MKMKKTWLRCRWRGQSRLTPSREEIHADRTTSLYRPLPGLRLEEDLYPTQRCASRRGHTTVTLPLVQEHSHTLRSREQSTTQRYADAQAPFGRRRKMNAPRPPALDNAMLLLEILRCIPQRRYITSTRIHEIIAAQGREVSLRTVQRHLDTLCSSFAVEVDTRSRPYGYRWQAQAAGLNLPLLTPSEALLLQLARADLAELLPTRVITALQPLWSSAQLELNTRPEAEAQRRWLHKVARIPDNQPLLPPQIDADVLEEVSEALYAEESLALVYRNARDEERDALVWPLALVQQSVRLYLVVRFEGYDNQRILALSRIQKARRTGERFPYPQDFQLASYAAEGHFGIHRGRRVKVRFLIDPAVGRHLIESPLAEDQQVDFTPEGLRITATVVETELLHRWLRGWGDAIKEVEIMVVETT